jgi:hypothetical protein
MHKSDGAPANEVYYGLVSFDTARYPCPDPEVACNTGGLAFGRTAENVRLGDFPAVAVGEFMGSVPAERIFWSAENGFPPEGLEVYAELEQAPLEVLQEQASTYTVWDAYTDTALHEIGHTFTLEHVNTPFQDQEGNFPDPTFPRVDGSIGPAGFDHEQARWLDGRYYRDFMSYSTVTWVSDHNYRKLYDLLMSATQGQSKCRRVPHTGGPLRFDADGRVVGIVRTGAKHLCVVGAVDAVPVTALDPNGPILDEIAGRWVNASHHGAAFLYFPIVDGAAEYTFESVTMPAP